MEITRVETVSAPGGGYTSEALVNNPLDTRNLATIQRSQIVRNDAQARQTAIHNAYLADERRRLDAQAARSGFGEFEQLFNADRLSKLAGDFVGNYFGAEAGKSTTELLGSAAGLPAAGTLPEFDFGSFAASYDASRPKNAEITAASGYRARGGDFGGVRSFGSYGSTGSILKGEGRKAFTGYEKGSFGSENYVIGSSKFPSMQFKMPIGKVENYEL